MAASNDTGPQFIGVPDNYTVDVPRPLPDNFSGPYFGPGSDTFAPSYFESDEYRRFVGRSPEYVGSVQDALVAAGFVSNDSIRTYGTWGKPETSAMKVIMATANRSGMTWREVLSGAISTKGAIDASRPGASVTVSNPDDLKAYFKTQEKTLTGEVTLSEDALNAMVRSYQRLERSSAGSGTSTISAGTFAAQQIEQRDPGATKANRFARLADVMTKLVGQT